MIQLLHAFVTALGVEFKDVIDIYENHAHSAKVYLKFLVEFCILSVITYEFAISPLRFTRKCAIL